MPAHESSLKIYFMGYLIVKLFIKNMLLVEKTKNTVNYASTTNQINSY